MTLPADNLEHVRDLLAVVAAAIVAPYESQWTRCPDGMVRLLADADALLQGEIARLPPEIEGGEL